MCELADTIDVVHLHGGSSGSSGGESSLTWREEEGRSNGSGR